MDTVSMIRIVAAVGFAVALLILIQRRRNRVN